MKDIAIIAIGRNEGERLRRGLNSVASSGIPVIYVDSGSTDDSLEIANDLGAQVVELDMSVPFSAARARNAGATAALNLVPRPKYLQFIDGDCSVADGWLEAAHAFLEANSDVVLVTGWREELEPDASVYNEMCDFEWHRPAGDIEECGGDLMVRSDAHEAVGGYNQVVIAGEDKDYCLRLGAEGRRVLLPRAMTLHDVAMTNFGQWWKRAVRAGHAYAHINDLHKGRARRELSRALIYAAVLPIVAIVGLVIWPVSVIAVVAIYLWSYGRTVSGLNAKGLSLKQSLHHGLFLTISKFPNFLGMTMYYRRRAQNADMEIIEYK